MAVVKCKICGGDIAVAGGSTAVACKHCGMPQTIPNLDSGKKLILYSRALRLFLARDFDRAGEVYRDLASEFPNEAEAYWGMVLCRYGVTYSPPQFGAALPICHRTSFDSVLNDGDLERTLKNAGPSAHKIYLAEAQAIENARMENLERAAAEPPCDILICCGTDAVPPAQEIRDALAGEGCRIFFCSSGPEEPASEPALFAALYSARVMLVFGASDAAFKDPWIKSQWSRFLMIAAQEDGRTLIPCYRNVPPDGFPKEFSGLHTCNMDRLGALEDVLRRVMETISRDPGSPPAEEPEQGPGAHYYLMDRTGVRQIAALLSAGANHTAAVRADGKVVAIGYTGDGQCSVTGWRNAVAVTCGMAHTVALLEDGTAVAAGRNDFGQCNVAPWSCVTAIAAGASHTVGLLDDGTVVAAGKNDHGQCNVTRWTDVVSIAADGYRTIGLKADGTVLVAGWTATLHKTKILAWRDIVGIASGGYHITGLLENGSVLAVGNSELPDWRDIVSISAGPSHSVGLRSDGTVVAVGENQFGQCEVSGWRDIVAVAAGAQHTVGLRLDGSLVSAGNNKNGQCAVKDWKLFSDLTALEEKIRAAEVRRREREELRRQRAELKKELASLKGLFSGKRRKELEEQLEELESALEAYKT